MPPVAATSARPESGRFKVPAGAVHQPINSGVGPLSPSSQTSSPEGFFGTLGPFAPLTAAHHPMQYPAFGPATHALSAPSAPQLARAHPNMFAFNMPFPAVQGAAGNQVSGLAHPPSPASKSDSGSEHGHNGNSPAGSDTVSPVPDALAAMGTKSERSTGAVSVSQADAMAALQAAHFQQQQFAAFAAAASQAGQADPSSAVWPMGGGFMF